jgi:class 3 adenylate cyclase/predicted ATPase
MRCTKCGNESSTGRKFCATCGSPLSSRCPKCEAENAPSSAFCEDCGTALSANAASAPTGSPQVASTARQIRVTPEQSEPSTVIEGERKTVTALFADIKGSTELMADLDPEAARAIIDPALKLMIDAVRRYDGYVVQSTGDGIFALFGAPVAHEDHPQRSLYAALRLQEELKRYSDRMRQEGKLPLQARVGVNTGEVVVRSIQTGEAHTEYTPIGHTANLASRMQVLAPIGSIAATEQVRKLCEGYFLFNGLGPTQVKGMSQPVNVYEVTGFGPLRTRLQRAAGRGLTMFVGRQREMEALKHAAEQAKGGRGQIAAAMAEPGVGKSRLFFEFKATFQSGWMVLETFSISHGKASAYLPLIDLLRNYFRIASEDDERTRREKVAGRIAILDRNLEDTLPYLFSLLGIVEGDDPLAQMDGQIKKRRTLEAIKRILLRESLNRPLLVMFEDLHWIDSETQELLNLLADSIGSAKILLLVNYRPEYRHEWGNRTHYTQLRLDPLEKESAEEMLSALLGDGPDLQPLKRLIIERTDGNPFFMEETVQVLFDEGALARNGTIRLTKSLNDLKIPPTVQAILTARIDRLPPDEKDLLQTLAVLGKEFTLRHLKATVARSDSELERMLADLQMAEFIYEQPSLGDVEFTFKHALTQEVAYHSVLTERRRMLHERAGAAIEKLFADGPEEHIDQLAYHYGRGANLAKAIEYMQRAGEQAVARSSLREAVEKLTGALELLRTLPASQEHTRRELALQMSLGSAFTGLKGFGSAEREGAYTRAGELCQQLEENRELFPVLWHLCQLNIQRGELRAARELAQQSLSLAERVQDATLILAAHYNLGEICSWVGELTQAREHMEHANTRYDPRQHASLELIYGVDLSVTITAVAVWVECLLGRPDHALKRARASLERASALSHPLSRAFAPVSHEWVLVCARAAQEAEEVAQTAISLCTQQGFTELLAWANCFLGWALIEQGKLTDGIAKLSEGMAVVESIRTLISKSLFLGALADGYRKAGDAKRALELLDEAIDWANRTGERFYECELQRLKGEVLLMGNDPNAPAADNCFRTAIELARVQSAKSWELRATTSLAQLLTKQGRRDEARTMLADIYGWFTEGFDTPDLKDAKALLDDMAV